MGPVSESMDLTLNFALKRVCREPSCRDLKLYRATEMGDLVWLMLRMALEGDVRKLCLKFTKLGKEKFDMTCDDARTLKVYVVEAMEKRNCRVIEIREKKPFLLLIRI